MCHQESILQEIIKEVFQRKGILCNSETYLYEESKSVKGRIHENKIKSFLFLILIDKFVKIIATTYLVIIAYG